MLFQRGPKTGTFMEKRPYNPSVKYVTDIYDLIYFPPISLDKFQEKGITGICKALYTTSASALNNVNYQVYQIPGPKKYFGSEFLHGFNVVYDGVGNQLRFDNLDDTPQAYQYTKEMTKALEKILQLFLDQYQIYLYYEGETVKFLTEEELQKKKKVYREGRIVWDV